MDDALHLTEVVAADGAVIATEPLFDLTDAAAAYLASHSLADAPADIHA